MEIWLRTIYHKNGWFTVIILKHVPFFLRHTYLIIFKEILALVIAPCQSGNFVIFVGTFTSPTFFQPGLNEPIHTTSIWLWVKLQGPNHTSMKIAMGCPTPYFQIGANGTQCHGCAQLPTVVPLPLGWRNSHFQSLAFVFQRPASKNQPSITKTY